jgi:hypothetical protein
MGDKIKNIKQINLKPYVLSLELPIVFTKWIPWQKNPSFTPLLDSYKNPSHTMKKDGPCLFGKVVSKWFLCSLHEVSW